MNLDRAQGGAGSAELRPQGADRRARQDPERPDHRHHASGRADRRLFALLPDACRARPAARRDADAGRRRRGAERRLPLRPHRCLHALAAVAADARTRWLRHHHRQEHRRRGAGAHRHELHHAVHAPRNLREKNKPALKAYVKIDAGSAQVDPGESRRGAQAARRRNGSRTRRRRRSRCRSTRCCRRSAQPANSRRPRSRSSSMSTRPSARTSTSISAKESCGPTNSSEVDAGHRRGAGRCGKSELSGWTVAVLGGDLRMLEHMRLARRGRRQGAALRLGPGRRRSRRAAAGGEPRGRREGRAHHLLPDPGHRRRRCDLREIHHRDG